MNTSKSNVQTQPAKAFGNSFLNGTALGSVIISKASVPLCVNEIKSFRIDSVLALNYAPPGAEYGYFVHEGKGTSAKYGPRRYSEVAANDVELQMMIDSYVQSQIEKRVEELAKELDVELKAFSKK